MFLAWKRPPRPASVSDDPAFEFGSDIRPNTFDISNVSVTYPSVWFSVVFEPSGIRACWGLRSTFRA